MNRADGLILFYKKTGITSFQALGEIKKKLGSGRVGHTGTLDKFAQGLMLVLAGSALRLSHWFTHCDKQYRGTVQFGVETDTLDPEGIPVAYAPIPPFNDISSVLSDFSGEIMQEPPAYSAIHINGKRASDLARSGKTPEMQKRQVEIYQLRIESWQPPFLEIMVHCSSGTYIRSLARDIALAAGSRGHLRSLTRTQVGGFSLDNSGTSDDIVLHAVDRNIIAMIGIPWFEVSSDEAVTLAYGRPLEPVLRGKELHGNEYKNSAAVFCSDKLVAVIENSAGKWKYCCVLGK